MDYEAKLSWWCGKDRVTLQVEAIARCDRSMNAEVARQAGRSRKLAEYREYASRGGKATKQQRGARWASLNKSN